MNHPKNVGGQIDSACAGAGTATAAGSGDNAKVTTATGIDRLNFASAKLVIAYKAVLTEAATLSFTVEDSDCATVGGSYSTPVERLAKTAVSTGGTGGSTNYGTVEVDVDLSAYNRFLKIGITPDLSASGTDTLVWAATLILGGKNVEPA